MYVLKGRMVDVNKKRESQLDAGNLMYLNWQDQHRTDKESNRGRGFHLQIDRSWLSAHGIEEQLWEGSCKVDDPAVHHLLGKIYLEFRQPDVFSELTIEALVHQLCHAFMANNKSTPNSEPDWIHHLLEILHHSNEKITLSFLSEKLGIHPGHISRAIPIYLHTTLGEYLRREKIKRALPLIIANDLSLSQIAHQCEFSDQSHFTRIFKNYYGMTPSSFREGL